MWSLRANLAHDMRVRELLVAVVSAQLVQEVADQQQRREPAADTRDPRAEGSVMSRCMGVSLRRKLQISNSDANPLKPLRARGRSN